MTKFSNITTTTTPALSDYLIGVTTANLDVKMTLQVLAATIAGQITPTGSLNPFAGSAAPSGYLICDGSAISRTTYAALYSVISTTYGAGDGSTTFNIPDLRGRIPVGVGTATGAAGATAHTLGQKAGEETHTLTTTEMPSHQHQLDRSGPPYGASTASSGYGGNVALSPGASGDLSIYTSANGGGGAHNNMQPYVGMNYIIKT